MYRIPMDTTVFLESIVHLYSNMYYKLWHVGRRF
jgi:hypothetical protein